MSSKECKVSYVFNRQNTFDTTTTSALNVFAFPEPYSQPIDLTFCGVNVVTVFLNRTGTIFAAGEEQMNPQDCFTVTAGGCGYSVLKCSSIFNKCL